MSRGILFRRRAYRLDGALTTTRGSYTLKIGPVSRAFVVERGSVRYFGTPDLNADLDIRARHIVQTADRTEEGFPIIAKITGTLLVPRLSLESGPPNPPMSERDLISLLIVGRTSGNLLSSGNDAPLQAGLAYLSGALSSELQRTLITDLGVPVDLIEIRSPFSTSGVLSASTGLTQLAAGWRIGSKWFVTLNAGFCPAIGQIDARNFGASLEYRLSRDWRLQANAEPIQSCDAARPADALAALRRYQFGADIRWEREY